MKLLTNIDGVALRGTLLHARAVVLADADDVHDSARITLYGTEATWPVATLPSSDPVEAYAATDHAGNAILLRDDGDEIPINGGVLLSWGEGHPQLLLHPDDYRRPLDVADLPMPRKADFETEDDWSAAHHAFYDTAWGLLRSKVAEYWSAPNMPLLAWHPAEQVRDVLRAPR